VTHTSKAIKVFKPDYSSSSKKIQFSTKKTPNFMHMINFAGSLWDAMEVPLTSQAIHELTLLMLFNTLSRLQLCPFGAKIAP
jgi:hypothetical protein